MNKVIIISAGPHLSRQSLISISFNKVILILQSMSLNIVYILNNNETLTTKSSQISKPFTYNKIRAGVVSINI